MHDRKGWYFRKKDLVFLYKNDFIFCYYDTTDSLLQQLIALFTYTIYDMLNFLGITTQYVCMTNFS